MRIAIIEDDAYKSEDLHACVSEALPGATIISASDVSSGIKLIQSSEFNLVILDIALPSHPIVPGGGAPMSLISGGIEVLFEIQSLNRSDPCVIVTQYPEIEITGEYFSTLEATSAIKINFDIDILGCIQYSEQSTRWKTELKGYLEKI